MIQLRRSRLHAASVILVLSLILSIRPIRSQDHPAATQPAPAPPASIGDWKIAGPFGGTATSIAVDPSEPKTVLAGALNSLLFKSTDGGANWTLLDFPKRHLSELTSILIDPADGKHYLVGVISADGGGLFESHDGGQSWSVVSDIKDFGVRAISYAPARNTRFAAGTLHGVFLSEDAGKTWTRISDPENPEMRGITVVAFDQKDPEILYAGTSHLPWKTIDLGKNWTSIHNGMIDDSDVFSIYVNPLNPANILASACSGIYTSSDRGEAWRKLAGIPNTSRRTHVIRQDPSDDALIYAGTTTGLYKSTNHGLSWKTLTNTQANAMAFDPKDSKVIYTALQNEGIGKSENGGEQIFPVNHGFVNRVISAITASGSRMVAIETQEGDSTGIFISRDRGESWTQMSSSRGLSGVHLKAIGGLPDQDRVLLGASAHTLYKSIDGGATWKPIAVRVVTPPVVPAASSPAVSSTASSAQKRKLPAKRTTRPVRVVKPKPVIRDMTLSDVSAIYGYRTGAKNVFLAATDLGLLISEDLGEHWTMAKLPNSAAVTGVYFGPGDTPVLVAKAASGLYVSKDSGEHWDELSFPRPATEINDVALPSVEGGSMLIATRSGLFRSNDGQWTSSLTGLPASTVNAVLYAGEKVAFAVQYGRLYQSNDSGQTWAEIKTALPLTRIRQLWKQEAAATRVYGLTGDLGVLYRD